MQLRGCLVPFKELTKSAFHCGWRWYVSPSILIGSLDLDAVRASSRVALLGFMAALSHRVFLGFPRSERQILASEDGCCALVFGNLTSCILLAPLLSFFCILLDFTDFHFPMLDLLFCTVPSLPCVRRR